MDKRSSKEEFESQKEELTNIEEILSRGEYNKLSSEKNKVKLDVKFDSSFFGDISYEDFMNDNFVVEIKEKEIVKPKIKEITVHSRKTNLKKENNELW